MPLADPNDPAGLQIKADDNKGTLEELQNTYFRTEETLFDIVSKGKPIAMENPQPSTCSEKNHSGWKPNSHYKPPVLHTDMSPEEQEDWAIRFEAYITKDDVESQCILNINILLSEVMSGAVQSAIGFNKAVKTPIFDNGSGNSIMEKLRESWLRRYPILKRRQEFFKPQDSANFNEMLSRILGKARKADINKILTEDSVIAHVILTNLSAGGAKYAKILDRLLHSNSFKDGVITVDDITRIANIEESIEHQKPTGTTRDPEPLYKLPPFPRKPDHRRTGPFLAKMNELKRKGLCLYCATKHHIQKETCPAWGEECRNCGKMNHLEQACCSERSTPNKTQ